MPSFQEKLDVRAARLLVCLYGHSSEDLERNRQRETLTYLLAHQQRLHQIFGSLLLYGNDCGWMFEVWEYVKQYARDNQVLPTKEQLVDWAIDPASNIIHIDGQTQVSGGLEYIQGLLSDGVDTLRVAPCAELPQIVTDLAQFAEAAKHHHFQGRVDAILGRGYKDFKTKRELKGPEDVPVALAEWLSAPSVLKEKSTAAGLLHENAERVFEGLLEYGTEIKNGRRVKTYIREFDEHPLVLEVGMFVGLMAHANMGKTTFTNTFVYNAARQGFNVCYVTLEQEIELTWHKLAYLHSNYFRDEFVLPSWSDWVLGKRGGEEVANVRHLMADIKDRKGLPGAIDVQRIWKWPEIKAHLLAHDPANHYDILVVDYLAKLQPDGRVRNLNEGIDEIIADAAAFSRSFRDGEGIMVFTPIQTKRDGKKEAEQNEGNWDMTAIRQHSIFERDMDVIMALYTDDEYRAMNQLLLKTVKIREMLGSGNVGSFIAHRDPRTNLISGDASPAVKGGGYRDKLLPDDLLDTL